MLGVDEEPVITLDLPGQRCQCRGRHLHDSPALRTHQVMVRHVREVEDGGAMGEVDVLDHTELGEGLQRPVHGGLVDIRVLGLHPPGELVGRDVATGADQGADDGTS